MTYYVNTDIHPFTRQYLKATPWDDPKIYADTSPMTYIKQAKTPTLIQHGDRMRACRSRTRSSCIRACAIRTCRCSCRSSRASAIGLNKPKANRAAMQQNFEWFTRYIWSSQPSELRASRNAMHAIEHLNRRVLLTPPIALSSRALQTTHDRAADACRRDSRRDGPDRHARHDPERHGRPARRQDRRGRRIRARRFRRAPRSSTPPGRFVSPGIIDAHSHIAADSINEGGTTVSSMTGIEDVLDPTDVDIYRDLAGGLTVANVLHGSANPIGGKNHGDQAALGQDARGLIFEGAPPGIKFALGENPKDMRQFGGRPDPRRYPVDARRRRVRDPRRVQRAPRPTRASGRTTNAPQGARRGRWRSPPRRDLQLEPLVEILEGKRLVHAHTYRADEILMLIRLADEMGFKIATFQHVLEGYKVADEMAAHGAGASTFSDWWAYKVEAEDAIPYNAAIMHKRGVLVSINSDSAEHARRLNTEAAKSDPLGRPHRRRGAGARDDQSGEAARDRQPRRLARSRQGRRRGDLEQASAQHVRDRRSRLHRRAAVLRSPGRGAAADRCRKGEDHADRRGRPQTAPIDRSRRRRHDRGAAASRTRRSGHSGSGPVATGSCPATQACGQQPPGAPARHRHHQRAHSPITRPGDRSRHHRDPRQSHRGGRRQRRGARRRAGDRCEGRRGVSRLHRRAHVDRAERAGAARLRGRAARCSTINAAVQAQVAYHSRQRRDSGRARQRRHQRSRWCRRAD